MMHTEVHPSGDRSTMMLEGWRSRCARRTFEQSVSFKGSMN